MSAAVLSQFVAPSAIEARIASQSSFKASSPARAALPIPLPPRSQAQQTQQTQQTPQTIRAPLLRNRQVVDATQFGPMFQLFHLLSIPHILAIIRVLLIERSVLLVSSQLSILTNTAESLKELLWEH